MTLYIPPPAVLTYLADTADAASYTTATTAGGAGRWLMLDITSGVSSGTANTPSISGLGLTWAQDSQITQATRKLTRFVAYAASATSSGTIGIDFAAQTQVFCVHALVQWQLDSATAIVQSDPRGGTATSVAHTLAAFGDPANRAVIGAWHGANESTSPKDGTWTTLIDTQTSAGGGPAIAYLCAYKSGGTDTTPSASWTTSSGYRSIASELKAGTYVSKRPPNVIVRTGAVHRASRW